MDFLLKRILFLERHLLFRARDLFTAITLAIDRPNRTDPILQKSTESHPERIESALSKRSQAKLVPTSPDKPELAHADPNQAGSNPNRTGVNKIQPAAHTPIQAESSTAADCMGEIEQERNA